MNEQAIQDSYDLFVSQGYTKSLEEYKKLLATNPNALKDSYDAFVNDGYTKTIDDYKTLMGVSGQAVASKKKVFSVSGTPQKDQKITTGSSSEDGSSATTPTKRTASTFGDEVREAMPQMKTFTAADLKGVNFKKTDQERFIEEQQKKFKEAVAISKETKRRQGIEAVEEANQQKEKKAINKGLKSAPEFLKSLNAIDANLISKTEEDAIVTLRTKFSKFGINFEETGFGTDKIIAKTLDGKKSIEINLQNISEINSEESNKLKSFINDNAVPVNAPITGDLLTKSVQAQKLRKNGRLNPDGTLSTVKFTSFEEDGKYKVIPTLFPKDPNNYSSDPKTWEELPFKEAIKRARERGEVFDFNTDKEAKAFAKGSWKDVNPIDVEADKFYKARGVDYMSNKKTYDEYIKVRDMVDFLEEGYGGGPEAKKYPNLVVNGKMRSDTDKLIAKYKKQEEALRGQVFDSGFITEGKVEKAREDFDLYLDKKSKVVAQEAAKINAEAKKKKEDIDVQSLNSFGVSIDKISTVVPKNSADLALKNELVKNYEDLKLTQNYAAKKYEDAKTYFDAKANKQIQGDFEDNWSGFSNSVSDAYKNGNAAQQILAFALGIKDVNSKTDKEEASRIIVDNLTNQSGKQSRVMSRWQQASGFSEGFDVFLDNPFELALTMAGTSLSQILPYGMKIVAGTTAAGAGTGAAIGATGFLAGPTGIVSTPGGAIAGGVQGFRTGMAATSLAMEYTNSVLDVMRERGYDVNDPNQVAEALSDDTVWDEGGKRGFERGIPIAIVDYLSAGLAGKVFKPTSVLASTTRKVGTQIAERAVFDPLAEATGELAAQMNSGQEINWKEISAEALGGIGNNSSNMAINTYRGIKNNSNIEIANKLTDASFVGTESASDSRISSWANNMHQLGKIDADTNQRIQENVGLKRDAREALSVGENKNKIKPAVLARTMELMSAKEELTSSTNRREIYSDKIKEINEELAVIADTKELAPEESSVDLSKTLGTTKKGVAQYMIDGVRYTKEQFVEKTEGMTARRLLRSALGVKNDEETGAKLKAIIEEKTSTQLSENELSNLLNEEEDAIQEQTTDESVLRTEQTGLGLQEVVERNAQPEGITEETIINAKPQEITTEQRVTLEEEANALMDKGVESFREERQALMAEGRTKEEVDDITEQKWLATEDGQRYSEIQAQLEQPEVATTETVTVEGPKTSEDFIAAIDEKATSDVNGIATPIQIAEKTYISKVGDTYSISFPDKRAKDGITKKVNLTKEQAITILNRKIPKVSSKTQITTQTQENGQATTEQQTAGPVAGNRLFNKPLSAVKTIADRYYKRVFGTERPKYSGTRKIDEAKLKRLKDAFLAMENNPNDPTVKAAYAAMAKETIEQYQELINEGYTFEFKDTEPYANSQEMIDDLRNNKRLVILSTEAEFGNEPITAQQREENPLLRDSGFKDVNGKPLLINDVFRATHDFYGHAELGNSFGPKGEENAWQVHARMYSPLARRAMTMETRAQNAFVNFSGINDKIEGLREQARKLREEGDEEGAKKIVEQIYKEGMFGPQRVGLVAEEFSEFDEEDAGDIGLQPEGINIREAAQEVNEIDSLLDLDTTDKTNLQKVSEFLDRLDTALDLDPNELNDVTRVMAIATAKVIVKTLKALVNAGITLQNAIQQVSEIQDVTPEQINEALTLVAQATQNVSEGISEFDIPGFNRMLEEVKGIVAKSKKRGVSDEKTYDNVMGYVMGSKVYEDATDVQREAIVRKIRKDFGLKEKRAPSVARLLGTLKDIRKIVMTERVARNKQLKDQDRGGRYAVKAIKEATQALIKEVKELRKSGKINKIQEQAILNRLGNTNVLSEKSTRRFIEYVTKVYDNADYAQKLTDAQKLRKKIRSLSRDKTKDANLRDLASKFGKLDPSIVKSIEVYNDMAAKIKEAVDGSKISGQKVRFANTVNIQDATEYINVEEKSQADIVRAERIADLQELMGVDASTFTEAEMMALLEEDKPMTDKNEGIVRDTINTAFEIYSAMIQNSIDSGIDAFTGEDVEYTKREKEIISKFMAMDPNKMRTQNALAAVDALANFIENKSTASMDAVTSIYEGDQNAKIVLRKGIKAIQLKKYFSKQLGRTFAEQTTNLNIVFEKMFKGFNRGGVVQDLMGLTKLINKKAYAQTQSNNIINDYVKQFYNKDVRPNGQKFNTAENNTERGMAAFMLRNVIGTEQEMQIEFGRRKGLIEQSIAALRKGNEQEQKKAELYQKVYDKVIGNSADIQDIKDNTDAINLEAIDFWHKQWDNQFDRLSDVALNVYNKTLDRDLNYSPDKYVRMESAPQDVDLTNSDSAFINNTNGVLYNKKTGVLEDTTGTKNLPMNAKKDVLSYIDLSFDRNNSNSMYDALVDIETAAPIRQVQAFLNSDSFSKIVPNPEDAKLLTNRVQLYVANTRNKNPYSNDELSKAVRRLNKIATLGVGQALGGPTQILKQFVPVAMNTWVNAGTFSLTASYNSDFNNWISQSGYAIANRGIESQAEVESINKLIEEAANSNAKKAMELIEEANRKWLKTFLVRPDVAVARASFKAYYEKSLKQQGKDYKNIDYSNHPINETAANYAQRMVDRQQNVSDSDLAGSLFSSKETGKQVLTKVFMAFASFRMNQASRLGADLSTLGYWGVSTKEDKIVAARSLAGYAAEMATFRMMSAGITILTGYAAASMMGKGETDDEEDKRIDGVLKGQATSVVTDILSPLPILDKLVQTGAANFLAGVQDALDMDEEDRLALYSAKPEEFIKFLGMYGIAPDRAMQFFGMIKLWATGKYKDDFNKEHEISEKDRKALGVLLGPAFLTNIGILPPEVAGAIRGSIKMAKKKQTSRDEKLAKEDRELGKELLQGYENREDMKRYDPKLYEETFGEGSDWYENHLDQKEAKALEKAQERDAKDDINNYVPKDKKGFGSKEFGGKEFGGSKSSKGSFGSKKFGQ
jgi:hypothetical protein